MAKETKAKTQQEPHAKPPVQLTVNPDSVDKATPVYADSLVHLGVGPFISKLTFGCQAPTGRSMEATVTLVLPTNSLVGLVTACQQALTNQQALNKEALSAIVAAKSSQGSTSTAGSVTKA